MANDTTRMEKLADDLSAVTIPSCKHMEREEYRDCVLQMLDDLEQLGRRDGCIAAAWALDALPSLQRELAEARREITRLRLGMSGAADSMVSLGRSDYAEMIRDWIRSTPPVAPAPSDVKGEEPSASDTNCGGKHIESDTKLTPLTDPSVRGVLVDDGEPTKELKCFRAHVLGSKVFTPEYHFKAENPWQPVKLRPASEFGVAGAERIKELEAEVETLKENQVDFELQRTRTKELIEHKSDAERLRKAIEEALHAQQHRGLKVAREILKAALSPSPAAASGETDADSLYVEAMTDAIKRATSAPAAESQGNAQHHSEGAKILDGGSGVSAAESEVGERDMLEAPDPDSLWDQLMLERNSLAARLSASRARLAACEERCRELEAGIERHRRQHQAIYEELDGAEKFDKELWSLLAPKAGGAG